MNTFAGTLSFKDPVDTSVIEDNYIIVDEKEKTLFIYGETDRPTSREVVEVYKELFGELLSYDISISTEDKIDLLFPDELEDGMYEKVTFEGPGVTYKEILSRFAESEEVVAIREAEKSKISGNRVVKVDFVY